MDDPARALLLMNLAPAMLDVLKAYITAEDAYSRGDVTFPERAELRAKALADARTIVNEVTQEHSHA